MVEILLRHPGHLVPRQEMLQEIWGPRGVRSPNYLRVFVSRVRQKLEPDPAHPRYLLTATGLGLVFDVNPAGPGPCTRATAARGRTP
jgi:two-component system, OmpR family, KDP operon response regulator KdpE